MFSSDGLANCLQTSVLLHRVGGGDGKACPSGVSIHIIEMEITSSSDSGDQLVD